MASEVQMCNLALSRIGEEPISAIDEGGNKANLCQTYYTTIRDELLSNHDWGFARKRRALALLSEDAVGRWTYTYQMPVDCLKPRFVEYGGRQDTPFRIEGDTILTNTEDAVLVYTYRITDTTKFSTDFTVALWTRLAAEICPALGGSNSKAEGIWKLHFKAIEDAEKEDSKSDRDEVTEQTDSWITARTA
jgi:hypothetical protein